MMMHATALERDAMAHAVADLIAAGMVGRFWCHRCHDAVLYATESHTLSQAQRDHRRQRRHG